MRDDDKLRVQVGSVVQINPSAQGGGFFAGCFMVVTDPKGWGAEGYVYVPQGVGQKPEKVPCKAQWKEMELVGHAHFYNRKIAETL